MDYLTQYYKNLSEQLQNQVNELSSLLEAHILSPSEILQSTDSAPMFSPERERGRKRASRRAEFTRIVQELASKNTDLGAIARRTLGDMLKLYKPGVGGQAKEAEKDSKAGAEPMRTVYQDSSTPEELRQLLDAFKKSYEGRRYLGKKGKDAIPFHEREPW